MGRLRDGSHRRWQVGLATGCMALMLVAGTAPAASAASLKTVSATAAVPGSGNFVGTATATCPKGKRAVSGGFSTPVFSPDYTGPQVYPSGSFRSGSRSWTGAAYNASVGYDGSSVTYAYCLKTAKIPSRSATVQVANGGTGSATATCPKGKTAISGGFDSPGFDGTFVAGATVEPYEFFKSGSRGWLVREINYGVLAGPFVAYVYCGSGKVKTRSATATVGPYPGIATATATCKKGERVLAGGSASPGFNPDANTPAPVPGTQIFPYASVKAAGQGWTARWENYGAVAGTATVYAYCQPT